MQLTVNSAQTTFMRAHIHGRGKCFQLVHTVLKLLSADKVNWMAVYCSSPLPKDIRRNNQIAFKVPLSQSLSLLVSSCSCQQNWGKANFKLFHVAYRIAEKKSDSCINRERERGLHNFTWPLGNRTKANYNCPLVRKRKVKEIWKSQLA